MRSLPLSNRNRARLSAAFLAADLLAVLAALVVAGAFYASIGLAAVVLVGFGTAAVQLGLASGLGLYETDTAARLRGGLVAASCVGLLAAAMSLIGIATIAGQAAALRVAPIGLAAVLTAGAVRLAMAAWLDRHPDALSERVVLVGAPAAVARLLACSHPSWVARRVVGVVAIGEAADVPIATLTAFDLGRDDTDALVEDFWRLNVALRGHARRIDRVLIAAGGFDDETLAATLGRLEHLPFEIALLPHGAALADPLDRGACPVLRRAAITPWDMACKRAFDVVAAALLLVMLAPILLIIGALVRLSSPGPALFRQTRWGWNNEPFTVFKFRTMWADAADGSVQATRGDARITPTGGFLRSTSLDELPQLLNVLNGTMSLVGPRPHPVELNLRYLGVIARYAGRHRVLPGITGLAQVNGLRGETRSPSSMQRRVDFDLEYIRTRSFAADIWIMLRTVGSVVRGVNAY